MIKTVKKIFKDYKLLLRSIPALIVTLFCASVILMNLAANKTIVSVGNWFALDGGILVSWLSFMTMDIVTKRFGPKAATKLSIVATIINLLSCLVLFIVAKIPSSAGDYTVLDSIFGGTWFILLSSTIAFIASAIINNFMNAAIGKMFKKNPDSKMAYVTRTYISTFIGQFFDNLIFSVLTFTVFAPIFWDGFSWTLLQCITCALTGAVAELIMEIIFSPIGYKICKKWKAEKVGQEYIDAYPDVENVKNLEEITNPIKETGVIEDENINNRIE